MPKIYERLLSTNIPRERDRTRLIPNVKIFWARIVFVWLTCGNIASDSFFLFYYMIDLVWLFQKRSFVLSREHENKNVATIGTLLDQFMLSCK